MAPNGHGGEASQSHGRKGKSRKNEDMTNLQCQYCNHAQTTSNKN